MQSLWRRRSATVTEVQADLAAAGARVAYTTVQTMLNRLEAKGAVARLPAARAHHYVPLLQRRTVLRTLLGDVTRRFFTGSAAELASHLVRGGLPDEELDRLQSLIEAQRGRRRRP